MSIARAIAGIGSLLATSCAFAQLVPIPGVRDSLLWVVVGPWFVLLAGVAWSLTSKAAAHRSQVLRPIVFSVAGLFLVIATLLVVIRLLDDYPRELLAFIGFNLLFFSGPVALLASIIGIAGSRLKRKLRSRSDPQ